MSNRWVFRYFACCILQNVIICFNSIQNSHGLTCLAGNSVSQTYPKSLAKCIASPSTSDVSSVTLAAFLRPAGRLSPIFSSFSRRILPPFLLLARRRTPPRREAFKHSGGERRRCTSPTVTLYFEVEDRSDRRPGTEQNTSLGDTIAPPPWSFPPFMPENFIMQISTCLEIKCY